MVQYPISMNFTGETEAEVTRSYVAAVVALCGIYGDYPGALPNFATATMEEITPEMAAAARQRIAAYIDQTVMAYIAMRGQEQAAAFVGENVVRVRME